MEICLNGTWMLVCGSSRWNVQESRVVCRRLTGELNPSKKFAREINYRLVTLCN